MKTNSVSQSNSKAPGPVRVAVRDKRAEEEERIQFLNLRQLPARLTVQRTAWLLGVRPHSIQILVSYRLLKPLGTPARNEAKTFGTAYVQRLMNDYGWMDLATATLQEHWTKKNQRRSKPGQAKEVLDRK